MAHVTHIRPADVFSLWLPVFILTLSFQSPAKIISGKRPDVPDSVRIHLLTQYVTARCKTDDARVTSIFKWITSNIAYDCRDFNGLDSPYASLPKTPDTLRGDAYNRWYNRSVGSLVIKRRKGVCDGYARLFKAMCDDAHVESVCINGYARREEGIGESFAENHTWNAVKLHGKWHLLDATWASGYTDSGVQHFTRDYRADYFLIRPEILAQDRYPSDEKWLLMDMHPSLDTFFKEPLHHPDFLRDSIKAFSPANGLFAAAPGDVQIFSITGKGKIIIPLIFYEDYKGAWRFPEGQFGDFGSRQSYDDLYSNSWQIKGHKGKLTYNEAEKLGVTERVRNYTISGNTYTYNFKVPKEGVRYIRIFGDNGLLLTYAVRKRY